MSDQQKLLNKKAPAFSLKDQNGNTVKLNSFKGNHNLIVYFYPKALTPGCTVQAEGMTKILKKLENRNTHVVAISCDNIDKLKRFEENKKLKITLLSDPDHSIHEKYFCWGKKKTFGKEYMGALRTTFILDDQLKVRHVIDKVKTKTHHEDVLKVLDELF